MFLKKSSVKYPLEYRWLKAHKFEGLAPWHLIDPNDSPGIQREYRLETGKDIIPFARRQDNDDILGFAVVDGEISSHVLTVHLTWSGKPDRIGYPYTIESTNIFDRLSNVVLPATQDRMSEIELAELLEQDL